MADTLLICLRAEKQLSLNRAASQEQCLINHLLFLAPAEMMPRSTSYFHGRSLRGRPIWRPPKWMWDARSRPSGRMRGLNGIREAIGLSSIIARSSLSSLLGLVLFGTVVGLGLTELLLRVSPPGARVSRMDPDRGIFCQYDPLLGYDGVPDLTAPWPKGFSITLNSRGDRDRNHSTHRTTEAPRVVMLGDSFLWGHGVRDGDRISDRLPDLLRGPSAQSHAPEVINLAVSGYGTDQEALKYWTKGRQFQPDAVVLGFYSGNDTIENSLSKCWNCPKPRLVLRSGKLVLTGVPVPRVQGWSNNALVSPNGRLRQWLPWSELIRFLSQCEFPARWLPRNATPELRELSALGVIDGVESEPAVSQVDPLAITQAIVDRLRAQLASEGIPLVLLLIPSGSLYLDDDPLEAGFYDGMRRWAEAKAVPYVDYLGLTAEYRSHFTDLYFGIDGHWTPLGHELAARFVGRRLTELLAPRRSG
jgi:hypothetical protein